MTWEQGFSPLAMYRERYWREKFVFMATWYKLTLELDPGREQCLARIQGLWNPLMEVNGMLLHSTSVFKGS